MIKFNFTLASEQTGNEFVRTVQAQTFDDAMQAVLRQNPGAYTCVERYQDANGQWRYVPRFADEQRAAGLR